jgi:hypothetical protein
MPLMQSIANNWQKALPVLAVLGAALWLVAFAGDAGSERAMFAALLVIYMVHQIEEHLWPGGFRQFTNRYVFRSGETNWPVDIDGVALVNVGYVWLPLALAVAWPETFRWLGLGWIGLTLVNGITHIATSVRFGVYNPGLVTSVVLFVPFTVWALAHEVAAGRLTGGEVAMIVVAGVLLHVPVAALFVVPFRFSGAADSRAR